MSARVKRLAGAAPALLLLAAGASGQNAEPGSAAQLGHLAAVRAERAERFHTLWQAAEEPRRAAGRAALERLRSRADPINAPLSAVDLAAATRVLAGEAGPESVRADLLASVADSLDLQVVPGAFGAASEGRGEPLAVRVYPLEPSHPLGDLRLHLVWRSPSGEETRARSTTVLPVALRPPGFDLFVRAPLSEPGHWQLLAELELDGRLRRSPPVPVECVAGWSARRAALERAGAAGDPDPARARFRADLDALQLAGLRPAHGLAPSRLLARLEEEGPSERPGRPAPISLAPEVWSLRPEGEARRVLLLLAPGGESPGAPLTGSVGRRWSEAAERTSSRLLSAPFPSAADGGSLGELVRAARELAPGLPVLLVARGDAETRLRLALFRGLGADGSGAGDGGLGVDGLVLSTNASGAAAPVPGLPTLIVAPPGGASPPEDPPGVARESGAGTVFLTEPELPGIVERWLAR